MNCHCHAAVKATQFSRTIINFHQFVSRLGLRYHWSLAFQICRSSSCRSHLLIHLLLHLFIVCLQDVLDLFTFLRHDTHCSGWVDLVIKVDVMITIYHNIAMVQEFQALESGLDVQLNSDQLHIRCCGRQKSFEMRESVDGSDSKTISHKMLVGRMEPLRRTHRATAKQNCHGLKEAGSSMNERRKNTCTQVR